MSGNASKRYDRLQVFPWTKMIQKKVTLFTTAGIKHFQLNQQQTCDKRETVCSFTGHSVVKVIKVLPTCVWHIIIKTRHDKRNKNGVSLR